MRIAVIADIHGNVLALEAVLADLERRGGADRIVDLGDCASGPLWPAETMARLEALGALTVRGNHDRWVGTLAPEAMSPVDRFTHDALTPNQRSHLGNLPVTADVAPGILAFHAGPEDDCLYLIDKVVEGELARDRPEAIAARLGRLDPAVRLVLCGHSHRPDCVRLGDVLVVNPGSVGLPAYKVTEAPAHVSESGTPFARYVILDWDGAAPRLDFIAVPYAHEEAARQAEANRSPGWAESLRTGRRK